VVPVLLREQQAFKAHGGALSSRRVLTPLGHHVGAWRYSTGRPPALHHSPSPRAGPRPSRVLQVAVQVEAHAARQVSGQLLVDGHRETRGVQGVVRLALRRKGGCVGGVLARTARGTRPGKRPAARVWHHRGGRGVERAV